MSLTANAKTYNTYRMTPDTNRLIGPAHTADVTDVIDLSRKFAVKQKDHPGYNRPGLKILRTTTLADGTKELSWLNVTGTLCKGMTNADILSMVSDAEKLLALQDVKDLFTVQDINA